MDHRVDVAKTLGPAGRLCGSARLLRVEGETWANLCIFSWRREERAPLCSHQAKQCLHQLLLE